MKNWTLQQVLEFNGMTEKDLRWEDFENLNASPKESLEKAAKRLGKEFKFPNEKEI